MLPTPLTCLVVVFDNAKILTLKLITTAISIENSRGWLYLIMQRYQF